MNAKTITAYISISGFPGFDGKIGSKGLIGQVGGNKYHFTFEKVNRTNRILIIKI